LGYALAVFKFLIAVPAAAVDFYRKGCASLAASTAFFFMLSFFPLVFLLLLVLGRIVSQDQAAFGVVFQFLGTFFPNLGIVQADMAAEIRLLSGQRGVQGVILVAFVWAAMQVFSEIDYSNNVVFECHKKRNPVTSTIASAALLGLTQFVLLISYVATQFFGLVLAHAPSVAGLDRAAAAANSFILGRILPLALISGPVALLFRYLPRNRPRWGAAMAGALLFAPLWELAKHLFASYVVHSTRFGHMYGSLLGIVLGLLWIYYSAVLFLYCGAVVHRLQLRRRK
jgi:membrane protein